MPVGPQCFTSKQLVVHQWSSDVLVIHSSSVDVPVVHHQYSDVWWVQWVLSFKCSWGTLLLLKCYGSPSVNISSDVPVTHHCSSNVLIGHHYSSNVAVTLQCSWDVPVVYKCFSDVFLRCVSLTLPWMLQVFIAALQNHTNKILWYFKIQKSHSSAATL